MRAGLFFQVSDLIQTKGAVCPAIYDILRDIELPLTQHLAELPGHNQQECLELLGLMPRRIGHGTFLNEKAQELVFREKMTIEVCLSSNVM